GGRAFGLPDGRARDELEPAALASFRLGGAAGRLLFVNGLFSAKGSAIRPLPGRARLQSLAEALITEAGLVEPYLGRYADSEHDGFTALNTALARDGALVSLPARARLPEPIHLVFVGASDALGQPRILVVAGPGSEATIIEHYVGLAGHAYLTNAVTETIIGETASTRHYTLLEESDPAFHVGTIHVDQDRDSAFQACSAAMGGRLVRNNLGVLLRAPGASCALDGLSVVTGRQHVDNHVTVDHA